MYVYINSSLKSILSSKFVKLFLVKECLWRPGLQNIKAWLDNPPKVLQFIMKTPITAKTLNANLQKKLPYTAKVDTDNYKRGV